MIEINNTCPHCGGTMVICNGGEECSCCFYFEEGPVVVVYVERPMLWGV